MTARDFTHSIMFHHFHGEQHPKRQGSISADDFEKMIDWLGNNYNLISSSEYYDKILRGSIARNDICLSFDDALKCQLDIALPVLEKRGIKAFFFIYSSPFFDQPDLLEVLSYFRSTHFDCIDNFYARFFQEVETTHGDIYKKSIKDFDPETYLSAFKFYSNNDRYFRFLRDQALNKETYEAINIKLMADENFSISEAKESLWMSTDDVKQLDEGGHSVGLHSFSHPTMMGQLDKETQAQEYRKNYVHLRGILGGKAIKSMSHPCGNYNGQTLSILREMGVQIGFRSNLAISNIRSPLEIPREDHTNIMQEMNT